MHALQVKNLYKSYASGTIALRGIDFSVDSGEFMGLLGPNGAGKSTTIGVLNSLIRKTSGKVWIGGYDIDTNSNQAKALLGVVPQEFNFSIFEPVEQILINQAGYYGLSYSLAAARAEKYLKLLDLWNKRSVEARRLSGGMKRRLMIARALLHEPKILILDEPTAGVDVELRRSMWTFLKRINQEEQKTIILTTHYLEEAEQLCDRIAIINHGKIIANKPTQELLSQLSEETFILILTHPITLPPEIAGYQLRLINSTTLEVDISKNQSINEVFAVLNSQKILVAQMRNKVNRLEELFLRLVNPTHEELL